MIDLNEYRQQKKATEALFNQIITTEKAIKLGHDPLHAVYIHTQNLLSILVEVLDVIPEPSLSRLFILRAVNFSVFFKITGSS